MQGSLGSDHLAWKILGSSFGLTCIGNTERTLLYLLWSPDYGSLQKAHLKYYTQQVTSTAEGAELLVAVESLRCLGAKRPWECSMFPFRLGLAL